jgi:hypothetical protein
MKAFNGTERVFRFDVGTLCGEVRTHFFSTSGGSWASGVSGYAFYLSEAVVALLKFLQRLRQVKLLKDVKPPPFNCHAAEGFGR